MSTDDFARQRLALQRQAKIAWAEGDAEAARRAERPLAKLAGEKMPAVGFGQLVRDTWEWSKYGVVALAIYAAVAAFLYWWGVQ